MRIVIISLILFFVSGCSFIVRDEDNLKTYGIEKDEAEILLDKIDQE